MLLLGLVFAGCSDENDVFYETNDEFLKKNGIEDVVKVFHKDNVENETSVMYYGNRKGKDWFALFDAKSGILLEEWYGKDREYVRPEFDGLESTGQQLFTKLKSGGYVYVYHFCPDEIRQLVRLRDNQKVEYGVELDDNIYLHEALTENRIYGVKNPEYEYVIFDFEGNVLVRDASKTIDEEGSEYLFTGFKEDKVWIGYYDEEGNFQEVVSSEKFERNRKVHIGYGEYKEFYIKTIDVSSMLETDRGYAFLSHYGNTDYNKHLTDVFFINGDKLVFVPSLQIDYNSDNSYLRNWYAGSVLAGRKFVLSLDGEIIKEYQSAIQEDDEPLSYDEVIRRWWINGFERYNCMKNEIVWSVKIDKLESVESDAKVTMTLLAKNEELWSYQCEIVNRDGSKSHFKFELNVETGKITYL